MRSRKATRRLSKEEFETAILAHCAGCPTALRRCDWGWVITGDGNALCSACYLEKFSKPDEPGGARHA